MNEEELQRFAAQLGVNRGARKSRAFGQPDGRDLYVQTPLEDVSVAYIQRADDFIATRVFPNVPVQRQSGTFYTYARDNWFRAEARVRAPATESVGGGWNISTANYATEVYAFHKDVAWQDEANAAGVFNLRDEAAEFVTRQLLLTREVAFAQKFFASSIWGTDLAGVAAGPTGGQFLQWNSTSATPIQDIRTQATVMQQRTGFRPNVLVLSPLVYDVLIDHPTVLERIKYTDASVPDEALLARLFRIDRVLVAQAIQNTANEGAAESMSYIYGKAALLAYAAPNPGVLTPSAGYTFSWDGYLPGRGLEVAMNDFDMQQIKATRIEGEMTFDMRTVATDLGTFFTTAIA